MRKRILFVLLCLAAVCAFFAIRFARFYGDACKTYAAQGVKGELSKLMFDAAADALPDAEECGIAEYVYDSEGRLTSININASKVNKTVSGVLLNIENAVNVENKEFGIPLWTALGSKLLSGKGPKIPVTVIPVDSISYELKSGLASGGINQTVHRISLVYSLTVRCLAPFDEELIVINGEAMIAETLIIGEVPKILFPSNSDLFGAFE